MAQGSQYKQHFSDVPDEELLTIPLVKDVYELHKKHLLEMAELTDLTPIQCAFELVLGNRSSKDSCKNFSLERYSLCQLVDRCVSWSRSVQGSEWWVGIYRGNRVRT